MSFKHHQLVIDHSKTRGPSRAIMLALAYRANDKGECWPSLPRIAKDSGLVRSTVAERLRDIERMGEITIKSRGHKRNDARSNLYRITLAGHDSDSPPHGLTGESHSPSRGRQIDRNADGGPSATRTPDSPPRGPESSENQKSEPSVNRQSRAAGLTGQRIDYQTAEIPRIEDYGGDMHALIHNHPDPILAAIAVTGERGKRGWGHWVKILNRARNQYGREVADRIFRDTLAQLHSEKEAGEILNPGAMLNKKLKENLCPIQDAAP